MDEKDNINNGDLNNSENNEDIYSEYDKLLSEIELNPQYVSNDENIENKPNDIKKQTVKTVSKKKKKKKKKKRSVAGGIIIVTIILAISAILSTAIIVFSTDVFGLSGNQDIITIEVPKGASITSVAQMLHDEGIIDYPKLFINFCKLSNKDLVFYPGNHELRDRMSYNDIINNLKTQGKSEKDLVKIMFPEGITLQEAAQKLEEYEICDAEDFIWAFNTQDHKQLDFDNLVPDNDLKFYKMEGYCFPDTYEFYKYSQPEYVANYIKTIFSKKVYTPYYEEIKEKGLTLDQVITLASMVQSEAPTKVDMEKVASVFWNRLNNSNNYPLLQSDPTTNYVEDVIKANIDIPNEEMFTAYDTYKGKGLPPGAICNPGVEAIEAVLHPAETDYLYFCADLKTQKIYYAKTLAEHEANLKKAGLK